MSNQIPTGIGNVIDLSQFPNIETKEAILLLCDDLCRNMDFFAFRGEYEEWWKQIKEQLDLLPNQDRGSLIDEIRKKDYTYDSILDGISRHLQQHG